MSRAILLCPCSLDRNTLKDREKDECSTIEDISYYDNIDNSPKYSPGEYSEIKAKYRHFDYH